MASRPQTLLMKSEHARAAPLYITTAISYPNGPPHIGHAYEVIATDAIARFKRLDGYDVFFLTGTDEHGQKIQQTAAREGHHRARTGRPQRAALPRHGRADELLERRLHPHHRAAPPPLVAGDLASGWRRTATSISTNTPAGTRCATRPTTPRTRPSVNEQTVRASPPRPARRSSGSRRRAISSGSRPISRSCSTSTSGPNYVLPKERLNEVASFVRGGLQDLSISRTTFDWGVRVPGNDKHIMYVWVDALTNYITGVGFPDTDSEKFKRYWPADLHVIGKDIVRFHAVYWPAFLMSAGIEVPRRIFSHGFLFNRGEKMSKSVGNVVDPFTMTDAYGVDQFRYFFLREVPFGQDGNYSHEAIVNRINADLANDLGNLAQRSLTMINKQLGGVLPKPGALQRGRQAILAAADAMIGAAREHMKTQQLHQVLNAVWAVVADANRYFAGEAPWALAKTDPARQGTVLYVTAEVLRQVAHPGPAVHPGVGGQAARSARRCRPASGSSTGSAGADTRIAAGTALPAPAPVFPRYVEPESGQGLIDAGRQPLPSRFSRLRGRARRRAWCARQGRRHRRHGDDLDPGAAQDELLAIAERFPDVFCSVGTHPHHAHEELDSRRRTGRADARIPRWWRSARPGSTITTTTRRATRQSRAFAPISRPRARPACRW